MEKIDKRNIEDVFALTPMQEGMLFYYLKEPGSNYYSEQISLEISGEINTDVFGKAWNFVIQRNEMLRTVFRWENVKYPLQIVLKVHKLQPRYHDCSNSGGYANDEKIRPEGIIIKDRNTKFDLRRVPFRVTLCKLKQDKYAMIISNHHILYDGWSNGILLKEFFKTYNDLSDGKELLKPVKTKFKEFVKWCQDRDLDEQEKFWRDYLKGFDTPTELTIKKRRVKEMPGPERFRITLPGEITNKIAILVKNHKITLPAFLYSAWGILLQKYCSSGDVTFGTTVSGRSAKIEKIEEMVGLFINTVPLRIQTRTDEKISVFLSRINQVLQKRTAYENTPLFNIKKYGELDTSKSLFDTIIVIENYPLDSQLNQQGSKIVIQSYSMWEVTNYDITVAITTAGPITIEVIYDGEIIAPEAIERLANHYRNIMESMVSKPNGALREINMLAEEEKQRLLKDFNDIGPAYPRDRTIQHLFAGQVERTPHHTALVGKEEGGKEGRGEGKNEMYLTYRELYEKSRQLADYLVQKGVKPGDLVGIMVKRTPGMILGILGILNTGSAYVPLNPKAPPERSKYMLTDSGAKILLVSPGVEAEEGFIDIIDISSPSSFSSSTSTCQGSPANLAYIIYTSGSTGRPKGVPVTHANFSPLLQWGHHVLSFDPGDRVVQNLSYYFDWSVWEIFMALTTGAGLYMIQEEILLDARQYVEFLNRHHITVLHITPTQFQSLLHWGERFNTLEYLCIGAEKLSADQVSRSYQLIKKDCRVFNMYGPTEATIISAVLEIHPDKLEDYRELTSVPIGKTVGNTLLLVLDRDLNPCPIQVTGELYIGGDGLAHGYLNNPELTAEKFDYDLWDYQDYHDKRNNRSNRSYRSYLSYKSYYKTGDRVRWLPDGTIEFLGRIDFQLKIRGYRIEPGEIENYLLEDKELKEALVTARESASAEKYLCAYIVPDTAAKIDIPRLKKYLSRRLPDYMIPAYFILLAEMPLNPNGKIDMKALPAPDITTGEEYAAPANKTEQRLVEIWSEVLDREKGKIGVLDNFFHSGGHSLKATALMLRIHKEFNVYLSLQDIFNAPTIKELSGYIHNAKRTRYISISVAEKKEYYIVSSAQQMLYVLHQVDRDNTGYNITGAVILDQGIDRRRLSEIFLTLIARHESLRTSFQLVGNEPVQRIHDKVAFEIEYDQSLVIGQWPLVNCQGRGEVRNFIRPFDLSKAPLLRVRLIKLLHNPTALRGRPSPVSPTTPQQENLDDRYLLMLDMHHIISDGASIEVLKKEFTALYEGRSLARLRLQYRDYALWQATELQRPWIVRQEEYWFKQFAGEIPLIDLPTDFIRPGMWNFEGGTVKFETGQEEIAALRSLALENEATLYMVLIALFNIFLSKLSNRVDIVVGAPVAGRQHAELSSIIGMFVNTLALRNYPHSHKTVSMFLREVRENTLAAYENQDYPFEKLVERLKLSRDASRNPLFDVMVVLQNSDTSGPEIEGVKMTPYEYENSSSKFDITLEAEELDHRLRFRMRYSKMLFKRDTVERFSRYFQNITAQVLEGADRKISELEIIPADEKERILRDFNRTGREYPSGKTIHWLFAEQARKRAGKRALIFESLDSGSREVLDYGELNESTNRLARLLRKKGITRNTLVGLMVTPSVEMVLGIMGILKAGGFYLPLDPDLPGDRIAYMLTDSNASFLLTRESLIGKVTFEGECIPLESTKSGGESGNLESINEPADFVYAIYTSGTTGGAKGVLLTHGNLVNYVHWFSRAVGLTAGDRGLLTSSFAFDLGYTSLYSSILMGGELHIIPKETYLSVRHLVHYISGNQISFLKLTPSLFSVIAGSSYFSPQMFQSIRLVVLGGEEIRLTDVIKIHELCSHIEFMNHYGPTEATIGAVACFIDFGCFESYKSRPTIGKPVSNTSVYIFDQNLNSVPLGVQGELCIAGVGLAVGYLNRPGLTCERFKIINYKLYQLHEKNNEKLLQGEKSDDRRQTTEDGKQTTEDGKQTTDDGGQTTVEKNSNEKLLQGVQGDGFLEKSPPGRRRQKIYSTGDLARWLEDGNIEFLGRVDSQVKVRGFRIELGEIESRLLSHGGIKETVVTVQEGENTGNALCAYIVPSGAAPDLSAIKEYLAVKLPDYMIPTYFVTLEQIPLTPNGKVNRKALPEPVMDTGIAYAAPRDTIEKKLVEIWTGVLFDREALPGGQSQVTQSKIGIDDNFFDLGGHSLKATILSSRIHRAFNVHISLGEIFNQPVIRKLSAYIRQASEDKYLIIEVTEKKEYYALSSAQKRLYFLDRLRGNTTPYNLPAVMRVEGEMDRCRLERVLDALIRRHESLRTSFRLLGGEPVQVIHETVEFEPTYMKVGWESIRGLTASFIQPFNLDRAPLMRVGLVESGIGQHLLLFDMHHIISDGVSEALLVREFLDAYQGEVIPLSPLQYKDYSEWQNRLLEADTLKKQEEYWLNRFKGELRPLALATDFPRPSIQGFEGNRVVFQIDSGLTEKMKTLLSALNTTLYTGLLAVYYILLSRYTGQEDIVIGVPTAGRNRVDIERLIGLFVNTLPVRNYPLGETPFLSFLEEVKISVLEAYEHQDYPFDVLVDKLNLPRDYSRNPIFDVLFVSENVDIPELELEGLKFVPYEFEIRTTHLDLVLYTAEVDDRVDMILEYSTLLFAHSTAEKMAQRYVEVLRQVVNNKDIRLKDIIISTGLSEVKLNKDFKDFSAFNF